MLSLPSLSWLRELPNHVPTTSALLLETKDSFVSFLKNVVFVNSEYRFLFNWAAGARGEPSL